MKIPKNLKLFFFISFFSFYFSTTLAKDILSSQTTSKSVFTAAENWKVNNQITPHDRSPKGSSSYAIILGSGTPLPNPYRLGPSFAVISNGSPYFVDLGEGAWRGMAKASMAHRDKVTKAFNVDNLKYVFLTHLHCDHTAGIPSWILNAFKSGSVSSKEIYGPVGTTAMMDNIIKAWHIDIDEMVSSIKRQKNGAIVKTKEITTDGLIFKDANVKVYAYRKKHGDVDTFAYRFECADGRIFTFDSDGSYDAGAVQASKNSDVVFVEIFSKHNLDYIPLGKKPNAENIINSVHMLPDKLALLQKDAKPKTMVLIHEQDYSPRDQYQRTGLKNECLKAGIKEPLYIGVDSDIY